MKAVLDYHAALPAFRLFVLGAGFSKPAGLPLGVDLLAEVRQRLRTLSREAEWDGPLEQEIAEWQGLYPGRDLNIEEILGYSHRKHFLRLIGAKEHSASGSRSIQMARQAVQEILIGRTPRQAPSLYLDFARQLTPHDTVLTFNYDTLLEQALDDVGKPYTLSPEWWLVDDGQGGDGGFVGRYVHLFKLHGSVDWYDRHYHDQARRWFAEQRAEVPDDDPLFGLHPSVRVEPLARRKVMAGFGVHLLPRVFRVPYHRDQFPIRGRSEMVPFLLPPAYDKLLGHDPIRDLWENMHRTLDAYSAIIVVGYSMPRYDVYAYEALGRIIIEYQEGGERANFGHRRVPVQVVTLDESDKSLPDIPFLNPAKTRIWRGGFNSDSLKWIDWGSNDPQK